MTEAVQVALIVSIAPTLTAIVAAATLMRRLKGYKHEINHRMDELLATSKAQSHAEGRAEGVESERQR